jgi:acetyltransferase-like isoleucine patch superfamily enzyme
MEKYLKLLKEAEKLTNELNNINALELLLEAKNLKPNMAMPYILLHRLDLHSGIYTQNYPIEANINKNIRKKISEQNRIEDLIKLYREGYQCNIHERSILEPGTFMNGFVHIQNAYCQANLQLGNNVYIGHQSFIGWGVEIGSYSSIAMNATIGAGEHTKDWLTTHNIAQSLFKTTLNDNNLKIGNDCWIGANTFIRNGIKIADGSIIGAGSVVLNDTFEYSINVGNPSRIIKYRFNREIIEKLKALKWWKLPAIYLKNIQFNNINNAIFQLQEIDPNLYLLE